MSKKVKVAQVWRDAGAKATHDTFGCAAVLRAHRSVRHQATSPAGGPAAAFLPVEFFGYCVGGRNVPERNGTTLEPHAPTPPVLLWD